MLETISQVQVGAVREIARSGGVEAARLAVFEVRRARFDADDEREPTPRPAWWEAHLRSL